MPTPLDNKVDNESSDILLATNLTAGYQSKSVWKDANFSVKKGEFIGLLGPNGAGKTTLFRILLGLSKPTAGKLLIFGKPAERGNFRIGYVPQRRIVDADSKIQAIEYVKLGISGNKWGMNLSAKRARNESKEALQALKIVDGQELAERPLNELSGGELQRVFLAQALVSKPDLLLLDEPLANLDIKREIQLITLVKQVVKRQNIAVILIAHDINPLLPVVDRIIYIANGKLASGKPNQIITTKALSALYNAPVEVLRDSRGRLAVLGIDEAMHHDD
ncbi:MAG TPA: ATP-binding cassette domain-containing protein [Candidatus Saccharimonadales bacterium]|nr:ATP-binding cassette domain-containing protein [Candidatus Saccharimonadales bacterium]